ncbi:MAG TPA: hypothetical protein VJ852_12185 [Gemmatimonadaceae bacterium]|nr:hypothetical protein [Gemmatimonadaceae bacterium]
MAELTAGRKSPRLALTVLAAIHLTVVLWHGGAHTGLAVSLSRLQTLFVFAVILIAPIVATLLLWTPLRGFAIWLYFISMSAALLFGVYYHYIAVSPDNVHYLPAGADAARRQFVISAGAVAICELIATLVSGFATRASDRRPDRASPASV